MNALVTIPPWFRESTDSFPKVFPSPKPGSVANSPVGSTQRTGVCFISIDDNEIHNLRKLCDEVFGEENFVGQLTVVNNLKGRNDKRNIATCHEYLLIYGKPEFIAKGLPLTDEQLAMYNKQDKSGNKYQLRDLRRRGGNDRKEDRPKMFFPIYFNEQTGECSLEKQDGWVEILPLRGDGTDGRWRWGKERVSSNLNMLEPKYSNISQRWGVEYRIYLNPTLNAPEDDEEDTEERDSKSKSFWIGGELSTDVAKREYKKLLGNIAFDFPKQLNL
ncbi:MAG: hypothetical protein FWC92_07235 [Defluviitaleaceae bacterium]|nr:hypothetical protein [Defluviitaleaceae bacterium]